MVLCRISRKGVFFDIGRTGRGGPLKLGARPSCRAKAQRRRARSPWPASRRPASCLLGSRPLAGFRARQRGLRPEAENSERDARGPRKSTAWFGRLGKTSQDPGQGCVSCKQLQAVAGSCRQLQLGLYSQKAPNRPSRGHSLIAPAVFPCRCCPRAFRLTPGIS